MKIFYIITIFLFSISTFSFGQAGMLDSTFGGTGIVQTPDIHGHGTSVAVQADGKIIVAGNWQDSLSNRGCVLLRYNTDGTFDSSFAGNGILQTNYYGRIYSIAVQTDGKIVAGFGYFASIGGFDILRFNQDGSNDTTFGSSGLVEVPLSFSYLYCYAVAIQPDGKILATGYGDTGGGATDSIIVSRLNSNGSLDTSFSNDGIIYCGVHNWSSGMALAVQYDGKIIVAGSPAFALRLNTNGAIDSAFGNNGSALVQLPWFHSAYDVEIQPDQKILIGGDYGIARFHTDGSPDSSFGILGIANSPVVEGYGLTIQPDGKILFAGGCAGVNDPDIGVARFKANGTVDNSFGTSGVVITDVEADEDAAAIALQSDGKILVTTSNHLTCIRYHNDLFTNVQEHFTAEHPFSLFPNPAGSDFIINTETEIQNGRVEIFNIHSQRMYSEILTDNRQAIDIESFPPGIYFITLQTKSGLAVQKLIKQ